MKNEIAQKNNLSTLKTELRMENVQHIRGGSPDAGGDRGGTPPRIGMIIEDTARKPKRNR